MFWILKTLILWNMKEAFYLISANGYMQKSIYIVLILIASILIINSQIGCAGETPPGQNGDDEASPPSQSNKVAKVDIAPIWEGAEILGTSPQDLNSQDFYLFWDRSKPMGGHIHPGEHADGQSSALERIHGSLFDAHYLTSDYREGQIMCKGITDAISSFACDSPLSRGFFNGGDSRLGKVVENVIEGLLNGNLMGAALITDLTATTGNVSGAHTLLPYFDTVWGYFNEGEIHAAILGIRPDYWGVYAPTCPPLVDSPLGCWFHEGRGEYFRLEAVVRRPIYILIMGRSLEEDNRDANSVNKFARQLQGLVAQRGFDTTNSEFLTLGALGAQTDLEWNPFEVERGPIGLNLERGYSCKANNTFSLKANFSESAIFIDEIPIEQLDSLNTVPQLQKDGNNGISLSLDCESVRHEIGKDNRRAEGEKICDDEGVVRPVFSTATAKLSYDGANWSAWSSVNHRADATTFLTEFIAGLRPSNYIATISPFPPLDCLP